MYIYSYKLIKLFIIQNCAERNIKCEYYRDIEKRAILTTFYSVNFTLIIYLIAKKVLPSPEIVLLIAIILASFSLVINCKFVLIALKDSVIIDLGFLSTIKGEIGTLFFIIGISI